MTLASARALQRHNFWIAILTFECQLGLISGQRDHSLCQILSRWIICCGERRVCQRIYENATKQSKFRFVVPSFMKHRQKRRRWGRVTPLLNISEEPKKRIDEHYSLLAFKFPSVITEKVDVIIRSSVCDHCKFRFLLRYIFCL